MVGRGVVTSWKRVLIIVILAVLVTPHVQALTGDGQWYHARIGPDYRPSCSFLYYEATDDYSNKRLASTDRWLDKKHFLDATTWANALVAKAGWSSSTYIKLSFASKNDGRPFYHAEGCQVINGLATWIYAVEDFTYDFTIFQGNQEDRVELLVMNNCGTDEFDPLTCTLWADRLKASSSPNKKTVTFTQGWNVVQINHYNKNDVTYLAYVPTGPANDYLLLSRQSKILFMNSLGPVWPVPGVDGDYDQTTCESGLYPGAQWIPSMNFCCGDDATDTGAYGENYCYKDAAGNWQWVTYENYCADVNEAYYVADLASQLTADLNARDGSDACCGDDFIAAEDWGYCTVTNLPGKVWGLDWQNVECTKKTPSYMDSNAPVRIQTILGTDPKDQTQYVYYDDISVVDVATNTELVTNGNFESGTADEVRAQWGLQPSGAGLPSLKIEDFFTINKCANGDRCAIACKGCWQFGQEINIQPNRTYTISYKAARGSADSARAAIFISLQDAVFVGRDEGYIDDTQQYFCARDLDSEGEILYTPVGQSYTAQGGDWKYWNAQAGDASYGRIHSVPGTDFVSTGLRWAYCDIEGNTDYFGVPVEPYGTYAQEQNPTPYCICEDLVPGAATCGGTLKNCCTYEISPYSCDIGTPIDLYPVIYRDCGVCYGEQEGVPIDPHGSLTQSESSYPDTSTVIDPNSSFFGNPDKTCIDPANGGLLCEGGEVCVGEFNVINSKDSDGMTSFCCVGDATCQMETVATCSDQQGYLCEQDYQCINGHIKQSSETDRVCCDRPDFCYDPRGGSHYATSANINESFICYEESQTGLFAECCSESTKCFNVQTQNWNTLSFDQRAFGVGSALHSIFSFDRNIQNIFRTRVLKVLDPAAGGGVYGAGSLVRNGRQDFRGYDYLEFGIYFSHPQNKNPQLQIRDASGMYEFDLFDYSVTGAAPGRWHKVMFNLQDLRDVGATMDYINYVLVGQTEGSMLLLDNFRLISKTTNKTSPYATRYCSGYFKQWVDDFEPAPGEVTDFSPSNIEAWGPYKDVCNYNFYGWTGSACCGDDQTFTDNEYYEDTVGGCWEGASVFNDKRLRESTRDESHRNIIYFEEQFHECGGTTTESSYDGTSIITVSHSVGNKIGSWVCTIAKTWEQEAAELEKTSRLFLAAKLYNVSADDFTLSCGEAGVVTNDYLSLSTDTFFCVLNNEPNEYRPEKVYVGLAYNNWDDITAAIENYVPFVNTTSSPLVIPSDYLDSCTVAGDYENFSTCAVLSNGQTEVHAYHNVDQQVFIFGLTAIDQWRDETFFEAIWNTIKAFFERLFTTEPVYEVNTGLSQFVEGYTFQSDYKQFYLARGGANHDKTILATFEGSLVGNNKLKVIYTNFETLNLSSFVEKTDIQKGNPSPTKKDYAFACNASIVYLENIPRPYDYWNFYTSNIRISDKQFGGRIGNCNTVCGNYILEAGETCEIDDTQECSKLVAGTQGTASCTNCNWDTTSCAVVVNEPDGDGDGIPDGIDNCPGVGNPAQADGDNNGIGDACETSMCGNGYKESGEECDGSDFGGFTCIDAGYASGTLTCFDCTIDTAACIN